MDALNTLILEATRYFWPVLTLFQIAITIIAVIKVRGTGPLLMLTGTLLAFARIAASYLPIDMSMSDGLSGSMWVLTGMSFFGQLLFLIGLLLMVQKNYQPQEIAMGHSGS